MKQEVIFKSWQKAEDEAVKIVVVDLISLETNENLIV